MEQKTRPRLMPTAWKSRCTCSPERDTSARTGDMANGPGSGIGVWGKLSCRHNLNQPDRGVCMLKGKRIILRGIRRDDLPKICEFNNSLEVELAGGGDPPLPQSLERLQADFDQNASKDSRDGSAFAIEL